jgi:hypothetical protein
MPKIVRKKVVRREKRIRGMKGGLSLIPRFFDMVMPSEFIDSEISGTGHKGRKTIRL